MNDFTPQGPIMVHASPTAPQVEAGIRQIVLAVGPLVGMIGWSGGEGLLNQVLMYAGPLAAVIAFLLGQWATRTGAKKAATMAAKLPDAVASLK
jgi:hypothetical protein